MFLIYGRQNITEFLKSSTSEKSTPVRIVMQQSLPPHLKSALQKRYRNSSCKFEVTHSLREMNQNFPNIHHQGVILMLPEAPHWVDKKNGASTNNRTYKTSRSYASNDSNRGRSKTGAAQTKYLASSRHSHSGSWQQACQNLRGPIVILIRISDVQNMGNIARSAECLGIRLLLVCDCSAHINDRFYQVSAGAAHHLQIFSIQNTFQTLRQLKKMQFFVCGSTPAAATTPSLLSEESTRTATAAGKPQKGGQKGTQKETHKRTHKGTHKGIPLQVQTTAIEALPENHKLVILIGGEHAGLPRLLKEHCDYNLTIPLHGKTQSLNAASASAILLDRIVNRPHHLAPVEHTN